MRYVKCAWPKLIWISGWEKRTEDSLRKVCNTKADLREAGRRRGLNMRYVNLILDKWVGEED